MRRRILACSAALVAALALAGCAPAYSSETAQSLTKGVLAVTESSAAGDWATATAQLDELSADLAAARKAGTIDADRSERIDTAIQLVRTDLNAAIAAAEQARLAEQLRLAQEAAAAAAQAAQNDNKGPGKNNGKDKGGKDD